MPTVVFDTNILVSAFITLGGNGERAVKSVIEGKAELFTSIPLLTELARICSELLTFRYLDQQLVWRCSFKYLLTI
jgi:predicted nucleic acid-binding protein